jgi:hypothetical protein
VGVIQFPRWPVFSHVDEDGENTIRRWLDQNGVSSALRDTFQSWIHMTEHGGPDVVPGVIVKVAKDLEAFKGARKGEPHVYLVFCRGLRRDPEMTLLAATHKPKDALTEARRNRQAIERDFLGRRRREPVTRRIAGTVQR